MTNKTKDIQPHSNQSSNNTEHTEEIINFEEKDRIGLPSEIDEDFLLSFGQVFRKISGLSLSMALSYTFSFEVFLTVVLLSYMNQDEDNIAAATLISTMMNALLVIGMSPLFAMSLYASNKIGELNEIQKKGIGDTDTLREMRTNIAAVNRNGFLISAIITPPLMLSLIFSKKILADMLGQEEKVSEIAQNFLRMYSLAVPGLMARVSIEQMMFSFGRTKPAMVIGLLNLVAGAALSTWLGFGGLGMTKFGPEGIAGGWVIETYVTAIAYVLFLARDKQFTDFKFFNLFAKIKGNLEQIKELLKIGGPISFTVATEMAMTLTIGILAGLVGTQQQAALTFIMQFIFFLFIGLAAFGQSCSQEISRQIGAKQYHNANQIAKYGLITTALCMTPIPLALSFYPGMFLATIENPEPYLRSILNILVPIMSMGVISDSVRYNVLQQLRGCGDLNVSTIVSTSALALGMITAGVLGLKTPMGIYGIGAGYTGGIISAEIGLLIRWYNRIKPQNLRIINEKITQPSPEISITTCLSAFFSCPTRHNKTQPVDNEKQNLLDHGPTYAYTPT